MPEFAFDLLIGVRNVFLSGVRQKGNRLPNRLLAPAKSFLSFCLVFACAAALPLAAHGQVTVSLLSPKPGPNSSKVLVSASATSPTALTGWIIYVDDAIAYKSYSTADTLSETLTLANGRHILYVRAWSGAIYGTSMTLIVQVGPPPSSSSVLPTPPSTATVLTEIQNTTDGWTACSTCAGGINSTTTYWTAQFQATPSMSGSSMEFYQDGLEGSDVLFIKTMLGTNSSTHFLWDFWVYQDTVSVTNMWAAEFDQWQTLSGKEFMIGSQCDFGDGYWDTWDSANFRWIENDIPCPRWAANTWHHIQWYVERVTATQYRYDTLVVDGKGYGLNQVWAANPITWPDAVGIQWQLDQGVKGVELHEWTDNVKLTLW
jgi:hypothetical protein